MHYFDCLEGDDLLTPERLPPRDNPGHSWNMFTVLLPLERHGDARARRSWTRCSAKGIGIGLSYEAIHLTSLLPRRRAGARGSSRSSERIGRETVTLPLFPEMTRPTWRGCASAFAASSAPRAELTPWPPRRSPS